MISRPLGVISAACFALLSRTGVFPTRSAIEHVNPMYSGMNAESGLLAVVLCSPCMPRGCFQMFNFSCLFFSLCLGTWVMYVRHCCSHGLLFTAYTKTGVMYPPPPPPLSGLLSNPVYFLSSLRMATLSWRLEEVSMTLCQLPSFASSSCHRLHLSHSQRRPWVSVAMQPVLLQLALHQHLAYPLCLVSAPSGNTTSHRPKSSVSSGMFYCWQWLSSFFVSTLEVAYLATCYVLVFTLLSIFKLFTYDK